MTATDSNINATDDLNARLAARPLEILARVHAGRGKARSLIIDHHTALKAITGQALFPGSLNLVLSTPILLDDARALRFDGNTKLLWPAHLDGIPVWLYRWRHAPLHVLEIVSGTNLRDTLGLHDTDTVTIYIHPADLAYLPTARRLMWGLCWQWRQAWYHTRPMYYSRTLPWCRVLGATQEPPIAFIKRLVTRLPFLGRIALYANTLSRSRRTTVRNSFTFRRTASMAPSSPQERVFCQVQNLLNYTKVGASAYSAAQYPAGYHTIRLFDRPLYGQRDPSQRLKTVPIDFAGKTVLDIGTNQGGMLFQLADRLRWGVGIDSDHRMVNAANRITHCNGTHNLQFYVLDIETEPLDLLLDFVPDGDIDIVFLLSVCMWVTNWRDVIQFCARISKMMLFESNGSDEQQTQQEMMLRGCYGKIELIAGSSADDPGQKRRKLFLCSNARTAPIPA